MIEVFSTNIDVDAGAAIPFNNVSIKKGCTADLSGSSTISLNKCGVYMVAVDASASASTTIQMLEDGVAQPQAQSTGITPSFVTLVQVSENNCACPCASATDLQITSTAAVTFTNVNVTVTKIV